MSRTGNVSLRSLHEPLLRASLMPARSLRRGSCLLHLLDLIRSGSDFVRPDSGVHLVGVLLPNQVTASVLFVSEDVIVRWDRGGV